MKYSVLSDELKGLRNRKGEEIFFEDATGNVCYRSPKGDDGKVLHTTSAMTSDEKKGHYVYRDGLLSYETMDAFKEGRKEKRQNVATTSAPKSDATKPASEKKLNDTLTKVLKTFNDIANVTARATTAVAPFASLERYNEAKAALPPEVKDVIEENLKEFSSTTLTQVKDFFKQVLQTATACLTQVETVEAELAN